MKEDNMVILKLKESNKRNLGTDENFSNVVFLIII